MRLAPSEPSQPAGSAPQRRSLEVFDQLRRAIVTGELRPNEPLIEADLAARLAVSRTPVRESMQRLAASGLVVPRKRGWAVREFSLEDVALNAEVRAGLEGYAAGLAAQRASAEDIALLETIHRERLGLDPEDEKARVRTNRAFHDAVIAAARNPKLVDAIDATGLFYFNGDVVRMSSADQMAEGNADHAQILAAIAARDAGAAEARMRAHIDRTTRIIRRR
ncbi:GntR family transcriptional regulator [Phreatobacter cathodiphilus]|uniref:Phosphonate utilization associated transcriptional regulator n=1 Tax=Phreatobacter cathodiphilus TaxID=1868589 RepID=A0A2S0N817_9HYPH|nr:GntR family transcriptional regulator [Phreatobacter cathodiphilus]AVO44157.1 phosphonate utilization associated transcriptional regulator [Phreatobacter cathodiphilus]